MAFGKAFASAEEARDDGLQNPLLLSCLARLAS